MSIDTAPHEILGIDEHATLEIARAAYKRLAQIHHPDKGGTAEQFQAIRRALKEFESSKPCPVCEGRGIVRTRQGMAVQTTRCPRCWGG